MCLPNPLKRAFDHASCTAEGAQRLLSLLTPRLNAETYTEARALCDELAAEAEQARLAYEAGQAPITTEQKQALIALSNHQFVRANEKGEIRYGLDQLTQQQAADRIRLYNKIIDSRYPKNYTVRAEAYQVRPAA
ncbi:hypothetical protein FNT36_03100 [Hymenobacter setariae]|uniref:Uncharacterized protein n=1 Tax=Hymenobacter setariae TaxID=2594794 RepID=A0A558C2S3_9BACT|nr:hypothetical protein [Hymenobacter setariae]TVT43093.1 hypothetical protein FNT36_03100 [Hymenobacter setariae]